MNRSTLLALALAGLTAFALTACEPATDGAGSETEPKVNESSSAPAAPAPAESSEAVENASAPDETYSRVIAVGESFTWTDGVVGIVTGIADEPRTDYEPTTLKVVTVQVQNASAAVVDLSLSTANLVFGPAGAQAESELWMEGDATSGFEGSVPPGGTATAKFAYSGVTDASTMTFEFAPTWDYASAFWKQ